MTTSLPPRRIILSKETERLTGRSNQARLRDEKQGKFPLRLRLGPKTIAYYEDEVLAWIHSRVRGVGMTVPRGDRTSPRPPRRQGVLR